jgi:hypothetical protein
MKPQEATRKAGSGIAGWKRRLVSALIGAAIAGLGVAAFLLVDTRSGRAPGKLLGPVFLLSPMFALAGAVILLRGAIWGAKIFSVQTIFWVGVVALVIGGCPWPWLSLLAHGRAAAGVNLLGMLVFLVIGLPGLVLTLAGALLQGWRREED